MSAEALARTRIAPGSAAMVETNYALREGQWAWMSQLYSDGRAASQAIAARLLHMVRDLTPPAGPRPGFVMAEYTDIDEGIEMFLSASKHQLEADLAEVENEGARFPSWTKHLVEGDRTVRRDLARAMRIVYEATTRPVLSAVKQQLDADRRARSYVLATNGVGALLAGLHPSISWRPPVLELAIPGGDFDISLDDRGLLLVPSFFHCRGPGLTFGAPSPSALYYPMMRSQVMAALALTEAQATRRPGLDALLGSTRAAALEALALRPNLSTGALARRLAISPATASQHATVLRNAELIVTTRQRNSVAHRLTPLGTDLLSGRTGTP